MKSALSPHDIERLRREAKLVSRTKGITHTQALDRAAVELGFRNWSLLCHDQSEAPRRYPVFKRNLEEMQASFRKRKNAGSYRTPEDALRADMPDLSGAFANPMSALEYAHGYIKAALSLPRYSPHMHSPAYSEMRILVALCL